MASGRWRLIASHYSLRVAVAIRCSNDLDSAVAFTIRKSKHRGKFSNTRVTKNYASGMRSCVRCRNNSEIGL
jgi:hypothetical protein